MFRQFKALSQADVARWQQGGAPLLRSVDTEASVITRETRCATPQRSGRRHDHVRTAICTRSKHRKAKPRTIKKHLRLGLWGDTRYVSDTAQHCVPVAEQFTHICLIGLYWQTLSSMRTTRKAGLELLATAGKAYLYVRGSAVHHVPCHQNCTPMTAANHSLLAWHDIQPAMH
jgi:hypothetical protein